MAGYMLHCVLQSWLTVAGKRGDRGPQRFLPLSANKHICFIVFCSRGSQLLVKEVTEDHKGSYQCQATNIFGSSPFSSVVNISIETGRYWLFGSVYLGLCYICLLSGMVSLVIFYIVSYLVWLVIYYSVSYLAWLVIFYSVSYLVWLAILYSVSYLLWLGIFYSVSYLVWLAILYSVSYLIWLVIFYSVSYFVWLVILQCQ